MRQAALVKAAIESDVARFGSAFKLQPKPAPDVIPTRISVLDSWLGGIPRGAITEIYGASSSGRTSLLFSLLAQVTSNEEVCALIDTDNTFDPLSAERAGIDFQRLLWVRCDANLEHAFKATDLLLQGGGFSFVALDIGDLPAQKATRIIASWWYRIRRTIENTPTAFLVLTEAACVKSAAAMILNLDHERSLWSNTKGSDRSPISANNVVARTAIPSLFPLAHLLRGTKVAVRQQKPFGAAHSSITTAIEY